MSKRDAIEVSISPFHRSLTGVARSSDVSTVLGDWHKHELPNKGCSAYKIHRFGV